MLKVALVGMGVKARLHLEAWQRIEEAKVVGITGGNQQNRLNRKDIPLFDSIEDLLEKVDVDVVDLCVPTPVHNDYVQLAASYGKHIICENPLALNTCEANKMIEVCRQNNVHLFAAHELRFHPEYEKARQSVLDGAIGTPGVIRLSRKSPFGEEEKEWLNTNPKSGDILIELAINDFDWLRWTFGEVERVMAQHVKKETVDYALVMVRMKNGVIAHVEVSRNAPNFEASFELAGSEGMLTYNSKDQVPVIHHAYVSDESDNLENFPQSFLDMDPLQRELQHFTNCLLHHTVPIISCHDALKALAIAEAAITSAHTKSPIEVCKAGESNEDWNA